MRQRTILTDTVTRLFTDLVTKDLLEAAERATWPEKLWTTIEENGLPLTLVPEPQGGAGMTWLDAHAIVQAAGYHTVPLPLPETIVGAWLLARAGLDVPPGPLTIAPGEQGEALTLRRQGGTVRLAGRAARVPWGGSAGHVVAVATLDGRSTVALVARGQARVETDLNLAREPRDTLTFDDAPVVGAAPVDALPADAARLYGALVRSAQMAGALESLLAQSTRYAGERKQFGRAIGSFQAIQQQLAVLAGHTAAAGMAAATAFAAADRGDPSFEIAVAKARVGEAAGVGAGIAHEVHGAIGFTYEHSLHFATRRLWSWRAEFGAEVHWNAELGRRAAAIGADALWSYITGRATSGNGGSR